ncbi:hypothetical protein EP7_004048 [Isosphaeraceae bacterium EP7]
MPAFSAKGSDVQGKFNQSPGPDSSGGGYDLEGPDPIDEEDVTPIVPPIPARAQQARSEEPSERTDSRASKPRRRGLEAEETVGEVWSRWGESGGDFVKIVLVFLPILYLFGNMVLSGEIGLALLILVVGGLLLMWLAYPVLITLERPVRITPEQALKDYYEALSHHRPHFRRMWLLLSNEGRTGTRFGSFEGFKAYWNETLTRMRHGRASSWTPVQFELQNFKAAKSAGETEINATYQVAVFLRGKRADGPIEVVKGSASLVRGPDRMWYLDDGTLPKG